MKLMAAVVIAIASVTSSHAFSVRSYQETQAQSNGGENAAIAALSLHGYRQGILEIIELLRSGDQKSSYLSQKWNACIPADLTISDDIISAAIGAGFKDEKTNVKIFGKDWREQKVGIFVFSGLAKMFPCQTAK